MLCYAMLLQSHVNVYLSSCTSLSCHVCVVLCVSVIALLCVCNRPTEHVQLKFIAIDYCLWWPHVKLHLKGIDWPKSPENLLKIFLLLLSYYTILHGSLITLIIISKKVDK